MLEEGWGRMKVRSANYLYSRVVPVVRCGKRLELVLDEKLKQPIIAISGRGADEICTIFSEKFLTRESDGVKEVLIPLHVFPAVSVWLVASYNAKPSRELLNRLLLGTPTVLADLFWDLVELSSTDTGEGNDKPLINRYILLRASKTMRELLKLYKLM